MYDICVFGNAVVDCIGHVEEDILTQFKMKKGDFCHFDRTQFLKLNEEVMIETLQSGGAAANTAWTLAKLGRRVAYLGRVGSDPAGRHFFEDMVNAGVAMPTPDDTARTMEIFVLITPDGERTFAEPGTTAPMDEAWVDEKLIEQSKWLMIEGYPFLDQVEGALSAAKLARASGVKIALTLAAPFVIEQAHEPILQMIMEGVDLIFANEEEYNVLQDKADALQKAKIAKTPRIITRSGEGASYFDAEGQETHAPTEKLVVTDATGAGDTFAAGFLFDYIAGTEPKQCLENGHKLASQVIQQVGGRLKDVSADQLAA